MSLKIYLKNVFLNKILYSRIVLFDLNSNKHTTYIILFFINNCTDLNLQIQFTIYLIVFTELTFFH